MTPSGQLIKDAGRMLLYYVRGQLMISAILTAVYLAGFYWIGIPLWGLAAILCGVMNLIPFVGAVAAIVIPLLFSLAGGGGFREILLIILLFGIVQALETFYLAPKILGKELQLHPLVVFIVVLIGAAAFGPLGALLAAPAVAIALLVIRYRERREPHHESRSRETE